MYNNMQKRFIALLKDAQLCQIYRICDLVGLVFELNDNKRICLHIQSFMRVFDTDKTLVICTQDIYNRSPNYRKKWYQKYDWTLVGTTIFDDSIRDYQDKLKTTKISQAIFYDNDICLMFENGMRMDIIVMTTKYDDIDYFEDYRIFQKDSSEEHYVFPAAIIKPLNT